MPEISVIVPVYNVEKYLDRCVKSIICQSFSDFELYLVDDGSTDGSGAICENWAKVDDRIRVIHKQNGGLSDARNAALDLITGNCITFIDSDDYVSDDYLESLYRALNDTGSDISICNISSVTGDKINDSFYRPSRELSTTDNRREMFMTMYTPAAPGKMYKRFIYDGIRFPVGKLYEDTFIYHDVLAKAKRICFTGINSYYYLMRNGSIMHQEYKLSSTDIVDALMLRINKLEELGLHDLADENRPFLYSRVGVAFANLDSSSAINKKRLDEIKDIYDCEYPKLMRSAPGFKQRIRYWLLHRFPSIHTKLFGKNMSIA